MSKKRKYFDMHKAKYTATPKIRPEDLMKTVTSTIPVLAKDKDGRTLVDFPSVSVSSFPTATLPPVPEKPAPKKEEPVAIAETDYEKLLESAPVDTPAKGGELMLRSFLKKIRVAWRYLNHQVKRIEAENLSLKTDATEVRGIAEKCDNDIWDLRLSIDGLTKKMDAILETMDTWGVNFSFDSDLKKDTPPDTEEDGTEEVSGEEVANMVRDEEEAKEQRLLDLGYEKGVVDKLIEKDKSLFKKITGTFTSSTADATDEAKKAIVKKATESHIEKAAKDFIKDEHRDLFPPDDIKKTDKNNIPIYGGSNCHYCEKCKFSGPTHKGHSDSAVECRNRASVFVGEIIYTTRNCSLFQSITEPQKNTNVAGYDFSDDIKVSK